MFRRPLISLQDNSFPLFLDEEHNAALFDYQYHRQDKMNALMEKLLGTHAGQYFSAKDIKFSLIREMRDTEEYRDISDKIANGLKVHSTEYAFYLLLTTDISQLDSELMKRLQHIIATDFVLASQANETKGQVDFYQHLMKQNINILLRMHSYQAACFPGVRAYLLNDMKKYFSHARYINLQKCDLSGMDLSGYRFVCVNFDAAKFSSTRLYSVVFYDCSLGCVDMREASWMGEKDSIRIEIRNCKVNNAMLDGLLLEMSGSDVVGSSLVGANVRCLGGTFTQCNFNQGTVSVNSYQPGASFNQCDLSETNYESNGCWSNIAMNQVKLFKDNDFTTEQFQNISYSMMAAFVEQESTKIKNRIASSYVRDKSREEQKEIASMELCVAKSIVYSLDLLSLSPVTKDFIFKQAIEYFNHRYFSYTRAAGAFFHSLLVGDQPGNVSYQSGAVAPLLAAQRLIAKEVKYANTIKIV